MRLLSLPCWADGPHANKHPLSIPCSYRLLSTRTAGNAPSRVAPDFKTAYRYSSPLRVRYLSTPFSSDPATWYPRSPPPLSDSYASSPPQSNSPPSFWAPRHITCPLLSPRTPNELFRHIFPPSGCPALLGIRHPHQYSFFFRYLLRKDPIFCFHVFRLRSDSP